MIAGDDSEFHDLIDRQVQLALQEADVVLFVVDAKAGLTGADEVIAQQLRQCKKPIYLVINKIDGLNENTCGVEFYQFGFTEVAMIAATHGHGVTQLLTKILGNLDYTTEANIAVTSAGVKVAIVGKPNVGKSTLTNRILGEERVLVMDQPGTTRDSIFIPFTREEKQYTLIDTAGVRRRSRVKETVEKFSVIKTLQAIDSSDVVVMVISAEENVSEQDQKLLSHILQAGKAMVIAINKWDHQPTEQREEVKSEINRMLQFVDFARIFFISALHGTGVGNLFPAILEAYRCASQLPKTAKLNPLLQEAISRNSLPIHQGSRIKLRYAHPGGLNPPLIIIHGNQTNLIPEAYRRYLINFFRKKLKIVGSPLRIEFRTGDNPFAGRKHKPSKRTTKNKFSK